MTAVTGCWGQRSMSPSSPWRRHPYDARGPGDSRALPLVRFDQTGRTFSAWGPLGPWLMSNSTRWLSSNER